MPVAKMVPIQTNENFRVTNYAQLCSSIDYIYIYRLIIVMTSEIFKLIFFTQERFYKYEISINQ